METEEPTRAASWCPEAVRCLENIPLNAQCLLIICCSSLPEFSVQIFGCLTILASWCVTHSNIQVFIAFIQMFPFLHPNTPSTPSSKASVHAPANECVGTGISIVSPTMHTVIVRGSSLVKRVGSGARRGVGGG